MRVYRRGNKHYVDLKDPQGIRRRLPAFDSKRASEAFGRQLLALRDCRMAGERLDSNLLHCIETPER